MRLRRRRSGAAQQIISGIHDVVLVVGAEQQKTMPPLDGGDVLGAAADYAEERARYGDYLFPKLFARIAQLYEKRYGLEETQCGARGREKPRPRAVQPVRPNTGHEPHDGGGRG